MAVDKKTLCLMLFGMLASVTLSRGGTASEAASPHWNNSPPLDDSTEIILPTIVYRSDPVTHRRWPFSLDWSHPLPAGMVGAPRIQPAGNPTPRVGRDIFNILDQVRRFRENPDAMAGPCGAGDILIVGDDSPDEIVVIDQDTTIRGDVCIVNQGELRVEGAGFTLVGDMTIQQGGRMLVNGGSFNVPEEFRLQYRCLVMDSARFEINQAEVTFNGQNWSLAGAGNASVRIDNCSFPHGAITSLLVEDASFDLSNCTRPGEFIPMERSSMAISNCDSAIAWITFPDSSGGTFEAPLRDTMITHWEFPTPSVSGIDYHFSIDSTSNVLTGLLCSEETALAVENSDIVSLGIIFWEGIGDTIRVEGLVDDTDYPDYTLDLPDRTLRLLNTHVGAWNLYPFGSTILRMENDIFGEIMANDSSRTDIYNSICDGMGGHVMTETRAELVTSFSSMLTQVIARNRSLMLFFGTSFPSSSVSIDGAAVVMFLNSVPVMRPSVLDTGLTIESFVGLPSAPAVNSDIPVTGTALMTPGPYNQLHMDHYLLDHAAGVDPLSAEWARIDSVNGSVYQDTLGIWDTRGLDPGYHMLRLTIRSAYVDSFRFDMPLVVYIYLNESTRTGSESDDTAIPSATALMQNTPNPFNPSTNIRFALSEGADVRLSVYDIRGRLVNTLIEDRLQAGEHVVHWNGTDAREIPVSSGVYICRLESAGQRHTRKMVMGK